jgi:uncharacterized membrane protein YhaH (DUF805 family)
MNWYLKALKQYVDFSGRARRKEYWIFVLFNILFLILATILDYTLGTNFKPLPYGVFYCLYGLAVLLPGLAVTVRRLHDIGKSGWWYFIGLIPLVGAIILLVWDCTPGEQQDNAWGKNPKDDSF